MGLTGTALATFLMGGESSRSSKYGATTLSPSLVPDPNPRPKPMTRPSSPLVAATTSPRRERLRTYEWHDYGDEDEVDDDDSEEMEELVDIPYSILIRNYALVPIASLLFLLSLAVLFTLCWAPAPSEKHPNSYPYPPHIPELLVGAAAWIVSYSLRVPSFLITSSCLGFPLWLSTMLHVSLEETLRWGALVLLGVTLGDCYMEDGLGRGGVPAPSTQDEAFRRVFWVAVGWALVEVCWSVSQGYEQLALYRDVLPPSRPSSHHLLPSWLSANSTAYGYGATGSASSEQGSPTAEIESISHRYVHSAVTPDETIHAHSYVDPQHPDRYKRPPLRPSSTSLSMSLMRQRILDEEQDARMGLAPGGGGRGSLAVGERRLDEEMQQLINIQSRSELEMVFGVPPPNIPIFISILQRLDSILLTIGLTLILSSSYLFHLSSSTAITSPPSKLPPPVHTPHSPHLTYEAFVHTVPTFGVLIALHTSLSVMWTELLPRIGVHTASYVGLMVSLGVFFAGLAAWGALV